MTDSKILKTAVVDSFWKLDPRVLWKNPVMFVVEVGAVITLVVLLTDLARSRGGILVWPADYIVALVHGVVRELRGSDGRGPRKGSGGNIAQGTGRNGRA